MGPMMSLLVGSDKSTPGAEVKIHKARNKCKARRLAPTLEISMTNQAQATEPDQAIPVTRNQSQTQEPDLTIPESPVNRRWRRTHYHLGKEITFEGCNHSHQGHEESHELQSGEKEIRQYQKSTAFLIPRAPFIRLVKKLLMNLD
ncbi:hypothetical protein O6H91_01G171300 [Diphasiastrum complanatum]|uniref:Uncharacterized protein n=1 Tax=Diphasiastrum complanatum TaxID=34168 RepID=A0ACC2EYX9_DIPCM|nr:hypothetical protein O6H91_01G171300 [Diphasiastrum complanatum]